jgi:threonylcarbamoyladenosine tRNA methylthiotransferase MtaB
LKTVYLKNFGCKVNAAELLETGGALDDAGCRAIEIQSSIEIPRHSYATLIVNSCTVTAMADAKLRGFIRRVKRHAPNLTVILGGCTVRAEHFAKFELDGITAIPRVEQAVGMITRAGAGDTGDARSASASEIDSVDSHFSRTRAFIRVQDGCDCRCSYCIVPLVRPAHSIPFDDIRDRIDHAIARGEREIVLTGTNIGKYKDVHGARFADVFAYALDRAERAGADGARARVRVSSIEPEDVDDATLDLFEHHAACKHLHIPLESGSPRVLAAMRRRYGVERYLQAVSSFRARFPLGSITTDILVGFPTETDDDFTQTLAAMETAGFERVHVFRYSPRPGTDAARLLQVPGSIAFARMKSAIELGDRIVVAGMGRHVGETAEVLVEHQRDGTGEGYTGEYFRVRFPLTREHVGTLVRVVVERIDSPVMFSGRIDAEAIPPHASSNDESAGELR